jgi:parallel beta-helix repeat protein
MKTILGVIGILGTLVLGTRVSETEAAIINVPGSYTTIQAAVNAANNGDTITVAAGTYAGAIYVNKGISLIGAGSNCTTITGELDVPSPKTFAGEIETNTITFDSTATDNASISGFKIDRAKGASTWGGSRGNGIYCNNGSPTIINNIVKGNIYSIYCQSSSPFITKNIISSSFYGIYCVLSSPIIANNIVRWNSYIGIYCQSSFPLIDSNTITGSGNGIYCSISSPSITNNTISGNIYGIYCYSSSPTITNNAMLRNESGNIYHQPAIPAIK